MSKRPKITHVAVIFNDVVYSLPSPNRHHNVLWLIIEKTGVKTVSGEEQGFLDESGRFLRRKPALRSAEENNQIKPDSLVLDNIGLFSENLW